MKYVITVYLIVVSHYAQTHQKESVFVGNSPFKTTKRPYSDPLRHRIYYNPNNGYEAYWADGEWHIRDPGDWDFSNITTTRVPTVCGDECPYLYTRIGEVCGRKANDQLNELCSSEICGKNIRHDLQILGGDYITFKSYCKFLDFKCKEKVSHEKYSFVHIGKCFPREYHSKMYPKHTEFKDVFERMSGYLDDYHQIYPLQYLPSNYTTVTTPERRDA